jgi:hypothetical protein
MLGANPIFVEAGVKEGIVEFALAVRSLIQIKTRARKAPRRCRDANSGRHFAFGCVLEGTAFPQG